MICTVNPANRSVNSEWFGGDDPDGFWLKHVQLASNEYISQWKNHVFENWEIYIQAPNWYDKLFKHSI